MVRGWGITAVVAAGVAGAASAAVHPAAGGVLAVLLVALVFLATSAFRATVAFLIVLVARPADLAPALEVLKPAKVLAVLAVAAWLLPKVLRAERRESQATQGKWMVLLTVAVLASSVLGSDRSASLQQFTDSFVKILIMYVLIVNLVDRPVRVVTLHVALSACTTGLALYALHAKATGLATVEGSRAGFVGLLGDPNDLALVLVMYVPFLAEAVFDTRGRLRVLFLLQLILLAAGLVSTLSRGGLFGLCAGLGICLHDRGSVRVRLLVTPIAIAAVVCAALVAGVADRQSGGMQEDGLDESAQARLDAWKAGGRMILRHPLLGVGFGRFADNYEAFVRGAVIWGKLETHNSYIKVASETGLLGAVPFLVLLSKTFRAGYRLRRLPLSDTGLERAARRALFPGACGFCVCAFFLSQCWSWFFFILFAQAAAMQQLWRVGPAR